MLKKDEVIDLMEPRAGIAAVLPLVLGILFAKYNYGVISWTHSLIFGVVAILMQLTVNTWNNISDYRKNDGKWSEESVNNSIQDGKSSERRAWILLAIELVVVVLGGLFLVVRSAIGPWILDLGLIAAVIGYLYSGRKFALSWTPFGELFSGVTMGFIIFLAAVLVNVNQITPKLFWSVALTSVIAITAIANIMLANNLSDYEEDKRMNRHTLVYYAGVKNSLIIFAALYVTGYATNAFAILLGYLPWTAVLVYLSIPVVVTNVMAFFKLQSKKDT
ncbi:MAG: prenyltransferase, partial [Lactobacillaceae bacterium]|nr:prenyltransferase [Lactobacillaceae bacterium]